MKVLYFDCFSGISGDMTIGAFLDAGVDFEYLKNELSKLGLSNYSLKAERVLKNGLSATKFNVLDGAGNIFGHAPIFAHCHKDGHFHGAEGSGHEHHHEHDHEHGHEHHHDHENRHEHNRDHHDHDQHGHDHHGEHHHDHSHDHDHEHHHGEHEHEHTHDHGEHAHRGLSEIKNMINNSQLNKNVKAMAVRIFENIAAAESKMHNIPVDNIHFHEVGAIDSIIDITGTAICIDYLGIEEFYVSKVPISFGYLKFSHGLWPNPAPAALELLKDFKLHSLPIEKELVTPTGAAILKTLCAGSAAIPEMELSRIGYGAGYHDFDQPNVLRIMVGEKKKSEASLKTGVSLSDVAVSVGCLSDEIDVLTANIDDMQPEFFEKAMQEIMDAGALDVSVRSVTMKKGRPAFEMTIMCAAGKTAAISEAVFRATTTIGMRVERTGRLVLERKKSEIDTPFGVIEFKESYLKGKFLRVKPEYESLKKYAVSRGISLEDARVEAAGLMAVRDLKAPRMEKGDIHEN